MMQVVSQADTSAERATGSGADSAETASLAVSAYLAAFYSGDFARARSMVATDFAFRGPFLQVEGRDAFFDGAAGLLPIVRGHRVLRQWADGDDVCSLYEVNLETSLGAGSILMSEWNTVRSGLLTSGCVVFDTAAFRALVSPRP
jgi:hypothetical protein